MEHLRTALVFAILTISPLISESLLGNTPVTMAFSKSVWAPFYHKLAQHNFWEVYI